ncbi:hypothetical protein [Entomohabitans teleogrylli]|nr:hypothetical protein [Entomohabitans teleogrylli]
MKINIMLIASGIIILCIALSLSDLRLTSKTIPYQSKVLIPGEEQEIIRL